MTDSAQQAYEDFMDVLDWDHSEEEVQPDMFHVKHEQEHR
jgi:hypothetical protein